MTGPDHNHQDEGPVPGALMAASRPPVRLAQAISEWARTHLIPAAAAASGSDDATSSRQDQQGPETGAT
jgi:hypothetical protein